MESDRVEQTRDLSATFGSARPWNPTNIPSRRTQERHEDGETSSRDRARTCRSGEECKERRGTGLQDAQWENLARQLLKHHPLRHLHVAKESERPSEKMRMSGAVVKAEELNPPTSTSWIPPMGSLEVTQPVTVAQRSERQLFIRQSDG